MDYNGLGQRLSMDAAGVIATYVLDGDRPLTAESNGNTTFYLYGLGGIGEETNAWSYSLPDGTNTPRQLSDLSGEITLSARYTPWGDTLDTFGTAGNFTFGYLGGVLDATTGLLYVGNGQYYDPATGRFLTRDVYPNSPNPYVPWNPIGAILGPLAVLSLVYGRKKKRGKWDTFVILVLLGISAGIGIVACAPAPSSSANTAPPAMPAQTQTPVPTDPGTIPATPTGTPPAPVETPTAIPCPTPTLSNTPTPPVPTPINDSRFYQIYNTLMDPLYKNYWWRTMDDGTEMIMAVMSYLEFRSLKDDSGYIQAVTDALSNRYRYACPAGCPVVNGVLDGGFRWIMRWSHSLMKLENGMTRDLEASSIDPSFAKNMGESIIRNNKSYDYDKPFGAFNPQTDKEFRYFRGKYKFNSDTSYDGVYWWSPEGAKSPPVAIVITHRQSNVHCTTNNPDFGADKDITCGN